MTITVQGVRGASGAFTAGTVTSPSWTSTTGSTIVVIACYFNTTGAGANGDCTDSKSNSYTLGTELLGGTDSVGVAVYYNIGGTRGSSHTVTLNRVNSSGEMTNIAVLEITSDGTISYDSSSDATANDTTSPFTVTAAASMQNNAIGVYGCVLSTGGTNAWTNPTNYVDIYEEADGSAHLVSLAAYKTGETGTPAVEASNSDTIDSGSARQIFVSFYDDASGNATAPVSTVTATTELPAFTITAQRLDPYVVTSNVAALSTNDPSVTFTGYTATENDLVILFPSSTTVLGAVANASLPAGWSNPLGDGAEINSDAHGMACFYHFVTAAEQTAGTTTYTATDSLDAAETGRVHGVVVRNVNTTTPIDGFNTAQDSGNTVTPHVLAGITGSGVLLNNSLVVSSVAADGTGTYSSDPAGWTLLQTAGTTQGRWTGYRNTLTTVDTNVAATNITPSAGDEYVSVTLALTKKLGDATAPVSTITSTTGLATFTISASQTAPLTTITSGELPAFTIVAQIVVPLATITTGELPAFTVTGSATVPLATITTGELPAFTVTAGGATTAPLSTITTGELPAFTVVAQIVVPLATVTSTTGLATFTISVGATVTLATVTSTTGLPTFTISTGAAGPFATAVSANGRYLVDEDDNPWLGNGISIQMIQNYQPGGTEIGNLIATSESLGVNLWQCIGNAKGAAMNAPEDGSDWDGNLPYTSGNYETPNATYWVDTIRAHIRAAAEAGITVMFNPFDNISYGGDIGSEPDANMRTLGQELGNWFKDEPNILWSIGNDWQDGQWSALNSKYGSLLRGIREGSGSGGASQPFTIWLNYLRSISTDNTDWDGTTDRGGYTYEYPDINGVYTYYTTEVDANRAWETDNIPVMFLESHYWQSRFHTVDGISTTTRKAVRKNAIRAICWGSLGGSIVSSDDLSLATDTADTDLTDVVFAHVARTIAHIASLNGWEELVPDAAAAFVTTNPDTEPTFGDVDTPPANGQDADTTDFTTAGITADGALAIAYVTASGNTFALGELTGTPTHYWFDPTSGDTTAPTTGQPTYPGNNDAGDPDWLLVFLGSGDETAPLATITVTVTLPTFTIAASQTAPLSTVTSTTGLPTFTIVAGTGATAPLTTVTTGELPAFTIVAVRNVTASLSTITTGELPQVTITAGGSTTAPIATITAATELAAFTVTAVVNVPLSTLEIGTGLPTMTVTGSANVALAALTILTVLPTMTVVSFGADLNPTTTRAWREAPIRAWREPSIRPWRSD